MMRVEGIVPLSKPRCDPLVLPARHVGKSHDDVIVHAPRGKWKNREAPTTDQEPSSTRPPLSSQEQPADQATSTSKQLVQHGGQIPPTGRDGPRSRSTDSRPNNVLSSLHDTRGSRIHQAALSTRSPVSDEKAKIDKLLVSKEAETLLAHYDQIICPHQIAQRADSAENPYRLYVLPLAYEQIGLLYAVLALSACHLGHLNSDRHLYEAVAVNYRVNAITALGAAIRKGCSGNFDKSERDGVFATIQILLLHDICETGISAHGAHISGAMSICSQLMLDQRLTMDQERTVFFLGNLAWLDIIRAFSGPEKLCFTGELRERLLSLGNLRFEAVNGCPRELVLIIGKLLEQAKAHASGKLGVRQYVDMLQHSIHRLYLWDSSRCIYPDDNPLWISVAEAFRHACILRALRLLDVTEPAHEPRIQESVTAILDSVANVPGESPLIELMILPLFMAGADCLSPHSRHYILLRFSEIKARSEMSNTAPRTLLEKVWQEREKRPKRDQSNVPWMFFTYDSESTHQDDYLII
ncbi:fungal-specific transcription factor domain-containing protein [Penicillium alfredii]|uniref:Fungal-specific transcription factor domain-containing protein n=1 Tax=Penicillium alfredii TaxID=1506179 RepID=A0A9W9F1Z3_9EURO|nr:fungal-specific transcription factor domain-containing protein [Penicillium alfredii]KAJ5092076.1 fungal-specific transcription factor domain-containing protein [Penicillium alfredii]